VSDPREGRRGIVEDLLDPIAREFMAAMEQTLPGLPRARIQWAYHFFIGALLMILLHPRRPQRLSGNLCKVDDNEALLGEIIGLDPVGRFRPVQLDQRNVPRREAEQRRRPAHVGLPGRRMIVPKRPGPGDDAAPARLARPAAR